MLDKTRNLELFLEAVEQEIEDRRKQLYENPEKENNRLQWLEFQQKIDADWFPVLEEYLNVLGKLWFGNEMRLSGPEFRKHLVPCPAYHVTHRLYGPMAVFWVEEKYWEEREAPYSDLENRTELFKVGYRCRVTIHDNLQFDFQDDAGNTLVEFLNGYQVKSDELREKLKVIFADAYMLGAKEIYRHWKDFGIKIQEDETGHEFDV